jgi:hypothetical protein
MKHIRQWLDWLVADDDETLDLRPRRIHWFILGIGAALGYLAVLIFLQ